MDIQERLKQISEEGELWKPCPEFEEKYLISSYGRIMSIGTKNACKQGELLSLHQKKETSKRKEGFIQVQLFDNNRYKTVEVHRLVAKAFISNPNNFPVVTHLDKDKTNNNVSNLEWRSLKNINRNDHTKAVDVYNMQGVLVGSFSSIVKAARKFNVAKESIIKCCKNPYGVLKGLQFRYQGDLFQTKFQSKDSIKDNEEWREIQGYENYQVSNLGRVRNSRHWLMKPHYNEKGYVMIRLSKNNKGRSIQLHRLVANAFIPNPNNLPSINHIDEDKTNNNVDNLEWCTVSYNTRYSLAKGVNQYDIYGNFIKYWEAISDIERELNIPTANVAKCFNGKIKTTNGFIFLLPNDNINKRIEEVNNRKHRTKTENIMYERE